MSHFKMKYEIIPQYLTGPSLRRPCISMPGLCFMVAHDTGNPGSTAAGNVSYYERSRNVEEASAHIFVDDEQIIECIPFLTAQPEKAWHVRYNSGIDNRMYGVDANDAAGGVEMCYGGGMNIYESYKRFVWVLAYCCYKYGLEPTTDITGHHILDPGRKVDPMNAFRLLGKSFDDFICDVVAEYKECTREENDEPMKNVKLELWQWRMLGDALAGISKLPQAGSYEPVLSYEWAKKAYSQDMDISEGIYIVIVALARLHGIAVEMREN